MENKKLHSNRLEHIALSKASSEKISNWIIQARKKAVAISKKALLNWRIESLPETLTHSELSAIVDQFYSEEKLLRQLLKKAKGGPGNNLESLDFEIVIKARKKEREIKDEEPDSNN